jgi:hypothetical protein
MKAINGERSVIVFGEWKGRDYVVGQIEAMFGRGESEHSQQVALFAFMAAERVNGRLSESEWMFAIPNGGSRGGDKRSAMIAGAALKAEGVKAGVADCFLPVARYELHGLFIEMKDAKGGDGGSNLQHAFGDWVQAAGYGWMIANGWREAAIAICTWIEGEDSDVSAFLIDSKG